MKKKDVIALHEVLENAKLTGMGMDSKMVVLRNLRSTTPVFTSYKEDLKNAGERLKPEGFDDLMAKMRADHGKPLKECISTRGDIEKANKMAYSYNLELEAYAREVGDEEVDFIPEKIDTENFGKFMEANDIEASKLLVIPVKE